MEIPFEEIAMAILLDEVDAGVLIHEELLNWTSKGLRRLLCLGEEWYKRTHLPIPVGLNVVHRRLGAEMKKISALIRDSMLEASAHEQEARQWAMRYSMEEEQGIGLQFIDMFANEDTVELPQDCIHALEYLYQWAYDRKLIHRVPKLDIIYPE